MTPASNSTAFMQAVANRRSYYKLNKTSPLDDARIAQLVHDTVASVPSSFNAQSTRLVVLLGAEHDAFWDLVGEQLKRFATTEKAAVKTAKKNQAFRDAYGTILFYEDPVPLEVLKETFGLYRDKFGQWSEHTSAMHQFVLWTALEAEGYGANLQHYNPIIDKEVVKKWNVPEDWSHKAQLVFGGRAGGPAIPERLQMTEVEERVLIFGSKASSKL